MIKKLFIIVGVLGVIGAATGGALYYFYPVQVSIFAGLTRNYLLSWFAPQGTTTTELNAAYKGAGAAAPSPPAEAPLPSGAAGDWPSYNRTLASERHSPLSQINTKNVGKLKVLCTYDVGQFAAFESGLIMVDNALIGTTEFDIFSINPATCAENWRAHEVYPPSLLPANRGAAYMDGMLFRGTQDGRVLAYDFKTGKRLWERRIADAKLGESVPSAPIAWDGLVFGGNAGGDFKGGKGRMYALDAKTGKIVWEFFLVPRAEGEATRGPQGASPLNTSTWKNAPGIPISGGGSWNVIHARYEDRAAVRPRWQSGSRLRNRRARGREPLYRLGRRARRQDRGLQAPLQDYAEGLARLGCLQPARPDSNDGRQAAHVGRAQGRAALRFRSCQQ
jgi:alcohol dehydrogenase (cytochrome c)